MSTALHTATFQRPRASRPAGGFTLIEVLTAMMVLAIGLAGAMSLVYGSSRAAQSTSDRNAAAIVLQEAIEDIKRIHLITRPMPGVGAVADDEIGLYVETLPTGDGTWPNCKAGTFLGTQTSANGSPGVVLNSYRPVLMTNVLAWPFTPSPKYYGLGFGAVPSSGAPGFRVLYKLERHPDWIAGTSFSYEGMYVLTATVYKDLNPTVLCSSGTKKLEQISDPMVVFLRSRVAE